MNKPKKDLDERIQDLDGGERQRLYKRAASMRKASRPGRKGRPRRTTQDWLEEEDAAPIERMRCASRDPLDGWVGQLIEEGSRDLDPDALDLDTDLDPGVIVGISPGRCHVLLDRDAVGAEPGPVELVCRLTEELATTQKTSVAVGDEVGVRRADADADPVVVSVARRKTTLSRPDPGGGRRPIERVIAANVETVVVVASVRTPPLRPALIDRFLIAVERGGATPVVCVNKIDLVPPGKLEAELSALDDFRDLGIEILPCSAECDRGLPEIRERLAGETCVLVGHSGVGKSSLLNALAPGLELVTGAVNASTGKGKHTTTASRLHRLPDGLRIIDTPGIRELGLGKLSVEELQWYFHEFEEFAGACRFSDCRHWHEPGCAIKEAASDGRISPRRYDTYERLLQGSGIQ